MIRRLLWSPVVFSCISYLSLHYINRLHDFTGTGADARRNSTGAVDDYSISATCFF